MYIFCLSFLLFLLQFMEWKKAYYKFKKQCPSNDTEVTQDPESFDKIILCFGHGVVENYMLCIIK